MSESQEMPGSPSDSQDALAEGQRLIEINIRLLKECHARVENFREGAAYALQRLKRCSGCGSQPVSDELIHLFDALLGMDGKAHLKLLRDHEAMIMGLLAFRANAIETLLPEVCPGCGQAGRTHMVHCRYGMALTLLPEGMPSIEESASFKLGVIGQAIRGWADQLDEARCCDDNLDPVVANMREVASKI